jgi:hypothetical protein
MSIGIPDDNIADSGFKNGSIPDHPNARLTVLIQSNAQIDTINGLYESFSGIWQ